MRTAARAQTQHAAEGRDRCIKLSLELLGYAQAIKGYHVHRIASHDCLTQRQRLL